MSTGRAGTIRRGVTLIETIAAVIILAIAVPSVLYALAEAHRERANPTLASQARWLAQEKIEDIVADRNSSTRGYAWVVTANYPAEAHVTGFTAFARSVSIAETAADLVSVGVNFKTATVHLSWTDSTGAARSLQMSTVVTNF